MDIGVQFSIMLTKYVIDGIVWAFMVLLLSLTFSGIHGGKSERIMSWVDQSLLSSFPNVSYEQLQLCYPNTSTLYAIPRRFQKVSSTQGRFRIVILPLSSAPIELSSFGILNGKCLCDFVRMEKR
jgi:hypothetical protein